MPVAKNTKGGIDNPFLSNEIRISKMEGVSDASFIVCIEDIAC